MPVKFKQNFEKGVNIDLNELKLPPDAVQFLKNVTGEINQNPGTSALAGANMGVKTPLEGNVALLISLPAGTNHCMGFYNSEQTNEGYFGIWNSNDDHTVWVINGDTGARTLVYNGTLPFELNPISFMSEGRCTLELRSYINPSTNIESNFKFLIFTLNNSQQYYISVDDSIATNSFTTSPYFDGAGTFYDPLELVHLGVPTPLSEILINPVTPSGGDAEKQNFITKQGFQFRVKFIDVYGRESEHGIISNTQIVAVDGGCLAASNASPRCLDITFEAGNPLVDTIQIEFRTWKGNDTDTALQTGWMLYDTINKWINAPGLHWYERSPNTVYYNPSNNTIIYRFCNNKKQEPISDAETSRTEPELPRISNGVGSLNKRLFLENNARGFSLINPAEISKVLYNAIIPSDIPCVSPAMRTIIVYAYIYRPFNDTYGTIRLSHDKVVFGNEDGDCGGSNGNSFRMDQVFGDQANPGFIFYLAGTAYNCVAQWGELNRGTGVFIPRPSYPSSFTHTAICQIKITAPAGKYILRGASHKAKITDGDYQSTSTYIAGYTTLNNATSGAFATTDYARNPIKELEIDCTLGDIIYNGLSNPMFVILDLSCPGASAIDGYLCEQIGQNIPVEMSPVNFAQLLGGPSGDSYGSWFTDHNGFFFGTCATNGTIAIMIPGDICTGTYVGGYLINENTGILHLDGAGIGGECSISGNWRNTGYLTGPSAYGYPYPENARRRITQSIFACDTATGVSNMPVVMTKGAIGFTDITGTVTVIAHNRVNYAAIPWGSITSPYTIPSGLGTPILTSLIPNYGISPAADDVLVFIQRGTCRWTACGGCTPSIPDVSIIYKPCGSPRDTTLTDAFVALATINVSGVQTGGKYGVGFWLMDEIGRHTFFQIPEGEAAFVTMLNLNDAGYQKFLLPSIGYSITSSFAVPTIFKKMIFGVTANLAFSDFFSWATDWVQFIDNTGNTNTVNPTQIRIYYGSLDEYNKANNYQTNNAWQFINASPNNPGAPVVGDVVQFLMNGNGSWLPSGIFSTVTNNSAGFFFTVDYQVALAGLTNGALFRVIRPIENQTTNLYYEQCLVIDLNEDGTVPADKLTGIIPYVDSYMLARQLPVPILQGQPGAIPPGGISVNPIQYTSTNINPGAEVVGFATNNANNGNGIVIKSYTDAQTSFPFYFESPSPSDFWGSHLASRGRIGTINLHEMQQRIDTEMCLSAALGDRGTFNGLSYFDPADVFIFDRNTWGGIIAVLVQINRCLVICENDHFFIDYNTSNLTLNPNNTVTAQSQYGPFTTPHRPTSTAFGCSMQDINTIRKYAGKVMWLDHSGWLVMNDFTVSKDVSNYDPSHGIIGGYAGYLMNKISAVNLLNSNPGANGLSFFVGGIDPRTNEYYLTMFQYPPRIIPSYTNYEAQPSLYRSETIMIDLDTGMLKGFPGFTPEMYGIMPSYYSGRNFFTFKNGIPYKHHQGADVTTPPLYANFYGEQMPCYIIPVANPASETVKRFFWVEVYTKQNIPQTRALPAALFYCESIDTEKGQTSRLTPERFVIRDGFQAAEFLCDLNTPFDPNLVPATTTHKILDGNPLIGRWARLTLKTNPAWRGTYFEVSAVITGVNDIKISGE